MIKINPTLVLGLYLTGCRGTPVIEGSSVPVEPLPISQVAVVEERVYLQNVTLADLLDENSEVRMAENALLMVSADWCEPCHEFMPVLEQRARYAFAQGLTPEQLYFGIVEEFAGDLRGLLSDRITSLPTIIYLNHGQESSRIEQGGVKARLWVNDRIRESISQ